MSQLIAVNLVSADAQICLETKLTQLALLLGVSAAQARLQSLERRANAVQHPAPQDQVLEAFELAARIEATLPNHAGTALRTRTELALLLFDPPGFDRLTDALHSARQIFGQ